MSDGLGMRYAFIGPLETMHLNAEGMPGSEMELCGVDCFCVLFPFDQSSNGSAYKGLWSTLVKQTGARTDDCELICKSAWGLWSLGLWIWGVLDGIERKRMKCCDRELAVYLVAWWERGYSFCEVLITVARRRTKTESSGVIIYIGVPLGASADQWNGLPKGQESQAGVL